MTQKLALGLPGGYNVEHPEGFNFQSSSITAVINALIPYVFGILGFIFLFVLIFGGFELMLSGGSPEKIKAGQQKITNALIGLVVVMAAYWISQILEVIFGASIVGGG